MAATAGNAAEAAGDAGSGTQKSPEQVAHEKFVQTIDDPVGREFELPPLDDGKKGNGSPGKKAGEDTPDNDASSRDEAGRAKDGDRQGGQKKEPDPVPYSQFRETRKENRQLKERLARYDTLDRYLQQNPDKMRQFEAILKGEPAPASGQPAPSQGGLKSKDELAKEIYGVEKFDDLDRTEKRDIEREHRDREREIETRREHERTEEGRITAESERIADEVDAVLDKPEYKALKVTSDELIEFMARKRIPDPEEALFLFKRKELMKLHADSQVSEALKNQAGGRKRTLDEGSGAAAETIQAPDFNAEVMEDFNETRRRRASGG